jgi:opacity protein-like surface antigen
MLLPLAYIHAEEQFPFIGASIRYHEASPNTLENTTHTTGAFHVGKQTMHWRTTFSLEYGNDYGTVGLHVDYILLDEMFGTPKLRPYLGANINYLHYEHDNIDDSNGYSYGGQAGFIIYATDTMDIDIGYHYNLVQQIEGLDHIQGATFSIHYFY